VWRKRHLLVDTLGLVMLVMVTAADVQDRDGARTLLSVLATQFRRFRVIWADGAYAGAMPSWVRGLPEATEAIIHIAIIRLMVRRLVA
jgi:transposase